MNAKALRFHIPSSSQGKDERPGLSPSNGRFILVLSALGMALLVMLLLLAMAYRAQQRKSTCSAYAQQVAEVSELLRQGKFVLATAQANICLEHLRDLPCSEARAKLASLSYSATVGDILAAPVEDQGHLATLRWLEAERWASANGVPDTERISPMHIALQACNIGAFELARTAFLKAWEGGIVTIHDRGAVGQYYVILSRWGHELAFGGSPEMREQGTRLLATSHALTVSYLLPYDEACADLQALGYADCSQAVPDILDPVLAAVRR